MNREDVLAWADKKVSSLLTRWPFPMQEVAHEIVHTAQYTSNRTEVYTRHRVRLWRADLEEAIYYLLELSGATAENTTEVVIRSVWYQDRPEAYYNWFKLMFELDKDNKGRRHNNEFNISEDVLSQLMDLEDTYAEKRRCDRDLEKREQSETTRIERTMLSKCKFRRLAFDKRNGVWVGHIVRGLEQDESLMFIATVKSEHVGLVQNFFIGELNEKNSNSVRGNGVGDWYVVSPNDLVSASDGVNSYVSLHAGVPMEVLIQENKSYILRTSKNFSSIQIRAYAVKLD